MMRESASIISRFVDYYLNQGAERILLYYDGVCPEFPEKSSSIVLVVNIDESFKSRNLAGDPKDLISTQEMIFGIEHKQNTSDWLLVVDADEFVHVKGESIRGAHERIEQKIV